MLQCLEISKWFVLKEVFCFNSVHINEVPLYIIYTVEETMAYLNDCVFVLVVACDMQVVLSRYRSVLIIKFRGVIENIIRVVDPC